MLLANLGLAVCGLAVLDLNFVGNRFFFEVLFNLFEEIRQVQALFVSILID